MRSKVPLSLALARALLTLVSRLVSYATISVGGVRGDLESELVVVM